MLDEHAAKLLMTFQFTGNSEITGWFDLVRQVYEGLPDATADEFGARLTSAAGSGYDSTSVRNFVQQLESASDGLTPVAGLLEVQQQLPDLYWGLVNPESGAAQADGSPRFGWLSEAQRGQLSAAWGDQWEYYLGQQLDAQWGAGWEAQPADYKQAWLGDLITQLLSPVPAENPPAAPDLGQLVDETIRASIGEVEGADQLSEEELAQVAEMVRRNLEGEQQ